MWIENEVMEIPKLKKQLNLMPFSFSHDTKSTVKLNIKQFQ